MTNSEPSHIELLAPARDLKTGREAILHGADAVYIGAPKFGARAAAGNSVEDIAELVRFAHTYKVKVYVTLNTILYDHELDEARHLMEELAEAGVDALIVQDMALVNSQFTIHRSAPRDACKAKRGKNPQLRLHASTQMDNRTAEKVAWLRDLGFEQVVLARELTLEEIREIHEKVPDVRLEVFVHGAICVSYNGQCYASQHCFGRSANRGECAQFCRMPFDLIEGQGAGSKEQGERIIVRQKHLLSLRDMNRSNELEALLDAGARSLKIEGRLKDVSYVKNVVAYYRQRLNEIFRRRPEYRRSSLGHETIAFTPNAAKSFNRLFTNYFLHGRTPDMANIYTPKSMGEPLTAPQNPPMRGDFSQREISLWGLHNGDGLCYINEEGQLEGFRVNRVEGNRIYLADGSTFPPHGGIRGELYRNHDQEFEQQLSKPTAVRKINVRWLLKEVSEGFLLRLTREDGDTTEQTFEYPHELARSPQTEQIERQLSRLGDTPYETTGVDIQMSQNWFIPGSVLGEWRRKTLPQTSLVGREKDVSSSTSEDSQSATNPSLQGMAGGGSISYLSNVANHEARQFYLDHGAKQVQWAMEVAPKDIGDEPLIMTCRYCIRYELGMCRKAPSGPVESAKFTVHSEACKVQSADNSVIAPAASPLFLRLANGRRFRLRFDCRKCQMEVYAEREIVRL